jgi:hypothetical protein
MKTVKSLLFIAFCILAVVGCKSDDDLEGDWEVSEEFPAAGRTGAVSFTIGGVAYVGLGIDKDSYELNDFWMFRGERWTKVTPFPGKARFGAVAFSDGQYGYVGLGYAQNANITGGMGQSEWFKDFWRFDPSVTTTDSTGLVTEGVWTSIASQFPGVVRRGAVGFFVGGNGYVGTGLTEGTGGVLKNYYRFNPSSQTWDRTEITYGRAREGAVAFVIGNSAYIATGSNGSEYLTDVLRFTPGAETDWVELDPLRDRDDISWDKHYREIPRQYAVAFVTGNAENQTARAYIASGYSARGTIIDCWEFNPYKGNDGGRWEEVTSLSYDMPRQQAVALMTSDTEVGYIALGGTGVNGGGAKVSTFKFMPYAEDDDQNDQ